MQTTRRHFIQSSLAGAAGISLNPTIALAAAPSKAIAIGFQLFTVRGELARNVPGTLEKIGRLGYAGVEFWDYDGTAKVYHDYAAADLRRLLDENGLKCCGMHARLEALAKDRLPRTIETNRVLGSKYLNLVMAPDLMKSESGIAELAALLHRASAECRPQNLVVGYHCHGFDFNKINGRSAWDILFSQLKPEINMQLDVGNCLGAGGDPIAILKKFPGRSRTVHIKEHEDKTFDSDFYREVFQLCETISGTEWYIVEMGGDEGMGFDVPREALAKLHRLGK